VDADDRLSDGEAVLIDRALQCWTLDLVSVSDTPLALDLAHQSTYQPTHYQTQQRDHQSSKSLNILETHY
jgi:hypothetical protein